MSAKQKASRTDKEYERLGRMLETLHETGYADRKSLYKLSFVKGVIAGFGGVLGATILVGLLLWILSLFKTVPLVGPFVNSVQSTVKTQPK